MATRRSRLQIKPNILGGPKPSAAKAAPKSPVKAKSVSNEETSSAKQEITGNRVKSPTRLTSPRRNIVSNLNELVKEKTKSDSGGAKESSDKQTAVTSVSGNKSTSGVDTKSNKDTAGENACASLPTRARLRKFGKVNVTVARNNKTESAEPSSSEKQDCKKKESAQDSAVIENDAETKKKILSPVRKGKFVGEKTEVAEEKESQHGDSNKDSKSEKTVAVQRRSRFPKAKPNVVDASKRKERVEAKFVDTSQSSKKNEIHVQDDLVPEITVTTANDDNDSEAREIPSEPFIPPESSYKDDTEPKTPSTPVQGLKAPLKHPTPVIPISPEKRARTQSMAEPPVVKRQRKPKVHAPTDQPPDRATMKMRDLVRWNPTNNPMKHKQKDVKLAGIEKENVANKKQKDNVQPAAKDKEPETEDTALPVPQVTIGPDGNIVINEKSLVMNDPVLEKAASQEDEVIDETETYTTYGSFRKRNRSKRWSKKDTKKFYKALAMIGVDFFLINQLFPNRSRFEIKKKFKKEEKINRELVDKVLQNGIKFDPSLFDLDDNEVSSDDEEDQKKKKEKEKIEKKEKNKAEKKGKQPTDVSNTGSRKRPKKKNPSYHYYECTTDEEEEEEPPAKKSSESSGKDKDWEPSSVSQKDGEVVDILMDMSKGRPGPENQETDLNAGDDTEVLVAVPLSDSHTKDKRENATVNKFIKLESSKTSDNNSSVPIEIPGIHSVSILNTQLVSDGLGNEPSTSNFVQSAAMETGNSVVVPTVKTANSAEFQQNHQPIDLTSTEVQYQSNSDTISAGQSVQQSSPTQIQMLADPSSLAMPVVSAPINQEDMDQYVLVTVVPEGGGETVIHIYRLHGDSQMQGAGGEVVTQLPNVPAEIGQQTDIVEVQSTPDPCVKEILDET